jgi:hypothetical protein
MNLAPLKSNHEVGVVAVSGRVAKSHWPQDWTSIRVRRSLVLQPRRYTVYTRGQANPAHLKVSEAEYTRGRCAANQVSSRSRSPSRDHIPFTPLRYQEHAKASPRQFQLLLVCFKPELVWKVNGLSRFSIIHGTSCTSTPLSSFAKLLTQAFFVQH